MKSLLLKLFLLSLLYNTSVAYGQITKERKVEHDGFVWYKVKRGGLYGAEDSNGKQIIPAEYKYISYEGDKIYGRYSNQKGVFVVTHSTLGDKHTNYGYYENFKAVYNLRGECVIPFERGYTYINAVIQEKRSMPKLWYYFEIKAGGVEIEGVCNTEGKELWRRIKKKDYKNNIDYSDTDGFYCEPYLGERIKLNVFLSPKDTKWNTTISHDKSLTYKETLAKFSPVWQQGNDGKYRKLHVEVDGHKWYEVKDTPEDRILSVEDYNGNLIIGKEKKACIVSYKVSNYIRGVYVIQYEHNKENSRGEFMWLITEVYTKEGNLIIPRSREYGQIYFDDSGCFFVVQDPRGVGLCDLNGYEIVPTEYNSYWYDGYDFEGTRNTDGKKVKLSIHKRPTRKQEQQIKDWNGYYRNTPWLMMAGPQYTPTVDYWSVPYSNWNTMPIFGGVGDYVPTYSSDPCVNAAIGVANSTNRLIQQGVNVGTDNNSNSTGSSRKCPYCNGTGRKAVDNSVTTFGLSDPMIHCNECGRDYHRSTGHSHVTCGQCGGSGFLH